MVLKVPRDKFPEDVTPAVGQGMQMRQPDGGMFEVCVVMGLSILVMRADRAGEP